MKRLLIALLAVPALTAAAEIRSVEMTKKDGQYQVRAETYLDAPPEFVFSILLDYDEFHRLTRGITDTRWLQETLEDYPLAYTRIESCVAFFCRALEKVEMVKVTGAGEYHTETIADRSDFRFNRTHWRLQAEGAGTKIFYELEMQPDFWVPPLIGPWAIRRKAESSALKIAERMEYLAANDIPLRDFDLAAYLAAQ